MSFQLPFGVAPVNPVPVDYYSGPYTGVDLSAAVSSANSSIPSGIRFQSMEVRIIVSGLPYKYWYNSGTTDADLTPFSVNDNTSYINTVSGNLQTQITQNANDIDTVSGLIVNYSADSGVELVGSTFVMGGTGSLDQLSITSIDSNQVPLTVIGAAAQSERLQEWQDSSTTVVAYIDKDGNALFSGLTALGDLNVSGTLTYIHSTNVTIADKQLELASNSGSPISGDAYIDEGGIVLKSTNGDKEWIWRDSTDAWTTNQNINVGSNSVIFDGISQTIAYTGQEQAVSGNLQSQITSNDNDISTLQTATGVLRTDIDNNDTDIAALQTATGVLRTDIDSNDTDILALQTATGNLDTRVTQNASDIVTVSGIAQGASDDVATASGYLQGQITSNDGDITALQTATGVLRTDIDSNDTDILALQTATGVLRTDIDNNDTDILALQTATGVLRTDIDNNDTDILALQTATGVLRIDIDNNDTDILALQTATGVLRTDIDSNDTDILALQTATGVLRTDIDSNDTDIATVSGLLYDYWVASDGTNSGTISSLGTLTFTESGTTSITFDSGTNTLTIGSTGAGGGGGTNWNLSVEGDSTNIGDGETVEFTGQGNITLSRSANSVIISGEGSTYTAGTGLVLVGNEFNTSGTGTFDVLDMTPLPDGSQPAHQEGVFFYDDEYKTLTIYNDEADISLQVGQEQYLRVRNNTTGTILNGEAVRILSAQGTHPTITKAIATSDANAQAIGLATHDIEASTFGYVTTYGVVRNINTSVYSSGQEIFLSPTISGGLTGTSPIAPNYKLSLGHVIRSHASNGTILVSPSTPKLGGGDVKSLGNFQESGVAFIDIVAGSDAAIISSNTGMLYDSGNQILQINAGGVRFPDGATQTIAYTGQVQDLTGYATTGDLDTVSGIAQGAADDVVTVSGLIPTGTASGVAFFGDDNLLTEDSNFYWNTGSQVLRLSAGSPPDGTSLFFGDNYYISKANVRLMFGAGGSNPAVAILNDSGKGRLSLGADGYLSWTNGAGTPHGSTDIRLYRDAANTLAQRGNTQEFRIYHSGDTSNYERLSIKATGYNYEISPQVNGGTAGSVIITNDTSSQEILVVKGAPSQSANLQEWQDSAGVVKVSIGPNGFTELNGGFRTNDTTTFNGAGNTISFTNANTTFSHQGYLDILIDSNNNSNTDYFRVSKDSRTAANILLNVDNDGNISGAGTGIFQSGVQFPDGVTQTVAYTGQTGDWKVGVSGLTDTITSGETVTFTGLGLTTVTYDASTNTVSISGAGDGSGGGGGGTPGGSDTNIQFNNAGAFSGESNLSWDYNTDVLTVSGSTLISNTGTVFQVTNTGGTTLFAVEDSDEVQVIVAAQVGQSGNPFEVRDEFDVTVASIDVSGNISGNNIIFGDGTIQTTAAAGGGTPTGTASGVAFFGGDNNLTESTSFTFDSGNNKIGLGTGVPGGQLHIVDTWDDANTAYTGILVDITDTASSGTSDIFALRSDGVRRVLFDVDGNISANGISYHGTYGRLGTSGPDGAGNKAFQWDNNAFTSIGRSFRLADATDASSVSLFRDASNILAQRNGTAAQEFRIYHSGTSNDGDPTNYERLSIKATGYNYEISPQVNGGTAGSVIITNDTSSQEILVVKGAASQTANLQEWQDSAGTVLADVDNSGNISGNSVISQSHVGVTLSNLYASRFFGNGRAWGLQWTEDNGSTYNDALDFNGTAVPKTLKLNPGDRSDLDVFIYTAQDEPALQFDADQDQAIFKVPVTISGDVDITGALTATTKSFLIDHPTKEGMKLQYGSLEGPENGVYVRGTTDLSTIQLPDYWVGLVDENSITVSLTPIGSFQQLYVEDKNSKQITVGGVWGSYDYVVYGERKDVDKLEVEW